MVRKLRAKNKERQHEMFTDFQATLVTGYASGIGERTNAQRAAGRLFDQAYARGARSRLLARLTGKSNGLQILSGRPESTSRTLRTVVVSLAKIVGSEGRSEDFDANFNPLKRHNRERWISVAAARLTGVALPAVELVQAGNEYYVRDGHHRISVAKATGQLEIEARLVN